MRHKFRKRLALFCVLVTALVTVFSSGTLVYGAPNDNKSLSRDVKELSDKSVVLTRGNYLNYGAVTMTALGPTRIRISGETAAHKVCDRLEIAFYLLRSKDGEHYEHYRDWVFEKQNGSYFWKVLELRVPDGYYYALDTIHSAVLNGEGEMTETYVEGLWVN